MTLQERKYLVEECQKVAAAQSIRFSFLSGDVHVCAAGRLYSDPKVSFQICCVCLQMCMELNVFSIACLLAHAAQISSAL